MTDERKLNIFFYSCGLILSCIVLLIFQTPITLVAGLFLAAALAITHGFTKKPAYGFGVVLSLVLIVAALGFFRAMTPAGNFETFNFGFGGVFGSIYSLMLDDVRQSIENSGK